MTPPHGPSASLVLAVLLAFASSGCGGHRGTMPRAAALDPAARVLPLGTTFVQHVDLRRLRIHPAFLTSIGDVPSFVATFGLDPCPEAPFDDVESITLGHRLGTDPLIVFRVGDGAVDDACLDAVAVAILDVAPEASASVGPLRFRGGRESVDAALAVLRGDAPALADDPRFASMHERARTGALVSWVDVAALAVPAFEIPPALGISRDELDRLVDAVDAAGFVVDLEDDGTLALRLDVRRRPSATEESPEALAESLWTRVLPFARLGVISLPNRFGLEHVDSARTIRLAGAVDALRIVRGAHGFSFEVALDPESTAFASELVHAAVDREVRRVRTAEARTAVLRIAEALRDYAAAHPVPDGQRPFPPGSEPSPTEIPRGVLLLDAEPRWSGSPYREIGVAPPVAHRYQYAVLTTRSGFRVIARGDLDGDGFASEFTVVGTVASDGRVELSPLEIQEELE